MSRYGRRSDDWWPRSLTVAEQRERAMEELAALRKGKRPVAPVIIEGNTIARSFWGKAWCANLERYSDYASRLPRGRSYVRNGMVVDLQIAKGKISALVSGTELYTTTVAIAPVPAARWKAICRDCTGSIDSLVELLQGRLAKSVMDRVCRQGDGLFPAPQEIKLSCSCEDSARMCKHVAAVLYGVGARLDEKPELLFSLRDVDQSELIAGAEQAPSGPSSKPSDDKVLSESDVGALFGLEMAESPATPPAARSEPKRTRRSTKRKAASGR
ncbi:MAG: SWIM zinc finger family protein [Reyranellaceae bacterium]